MSKRILMVWTVLISTALAACGPQQDAAIPTAFDLNAAASEDAAAIAANATQTAPTPTYTRSAPTLPPEFTPTVPPTPTPPPTSAPATETPVNFNAAGTIYYIFNGDSIAALAGDGSREELIAIGGPYTDLVPSPDGKLLAYVAPGAGTAREVYIMSRDGAYNQQISCLGMANVRQPVWRPDGMALTFLASPAPEAPMDIYIANVIGANDCPEGNNQQVLVPLASTEVNSPAWNPAGSKFFYSSGAVFGLDMVNNTTYELAQQSGYGPNFSLVHSPVSSKLAFLRPDSDFQTGQSGGHLFYFDTTSIKETPLEQPGGKYFAQEIQWSADGSAILIATVDSVLIFTVEFGSSLQVAEDTGFPPEPSFNPNSRKIAYVAGGTPDSSIPQVFVVDRDGRNGRQLTFHEEGTISSLVWLEG